MMLRDLSYWGIAKLTLIVEILVPLLLTQIVFLFLLVVGADFKFGTGEMKFSGFDIYGFRVEMTSDLMLTLPASIFGVSLVLILFFLQCGILHFIFQKTVFGTISIG